jgi:hypothetical protein
MVQALCRFASSLCYPEWIAFVPSWLRQEAQGGGNIYSNALELAPCCLGTCPFASLVLQELLTL